MKIVKKENGNVLLTDASGNTIKRFPEGAVLELDKDREGKFIRIAYGHQNKHDIYPSTITHTQIEPAAEVAFSGTAQDLLNLLSTSFFFELGIDQAIRPYGSSQYYLFNDDMQATTSNLAFGTGIVYSRLIYVPNEVEIAGMRIIVQTGAVGNAVAGIYSLDANGFADQKIVQTPTEFDLNVTGAQTINFTTPETLSPGYYAVSYNQSAAATIKAFTQSLTYVSTATFTSGIIRESLTSAYNSTMPADISGGTLRELALPFIDLLIA